MIQTPDFTWLFVMMMAGLVICLGLAVVFIRVVLPRTRLGKGRVGDWARVLDTVRRRCHDDGAGQPPRPGSRHALRGGPG